MILKKSSVIRIDLVTKIVGRTRPSSETFIWYHMHGSRLRPTQNGTSFTAEPGYMSSTRQYVTQHGNPFCKHGTPTHFVRSLQGCRCEFG
jgi:hypothetical protein